jgi:uncharacterized damage-inducible protein DinB
MNTDNALTVLFRHNLWANVQLLEICAKLSDEQLDATIIGTFGTIRETMEHIATSERGYFSRISTGQRYSEPEGTPRLTLDGIVALSRSTGQGLIEWAAKVQPDDSVQIDWDGTIVPVPVTILLTQAINHATEHRSQIMAILTQSGIQPPELDGWSYFDTYKG